MKAKMEGDLVEGFSDYDDNDILAYSNAACGVDSDREVLDREV